MPSSAGGGAAAHPTTPSFRLLALSATKTQQSAHVSAEQKPPEPLHDITARAQGSQHF